MNKLAGYLKLVSLLLVILTTPLASFPQTDTSVYELVTHEFPAAYPGGNAKMYEFLAKNLKYPAHCGRTEGKVFVQLEIDSTGTLTNIKLIKGLSEMIDTEVLRVFNLMPKTGWTPCTFDGIPIHCRMKLPVKIRVGE